MDRSKFGQRLAFCVEHNHLTQIGLEMVMDAFSTTEVQEIGRHFKNARIILKQVEERRRMRDNLSKFLGGDSEAPAT